MNGFVLLAGGSLILGLTTCSQAGGTYDNPDVQFAPPSIAEAELPLHMGGSEQPQDRDGPAYPVGSAPAINDIGSEQIPDFPAGPEPQIRDNGMDMIMPNGGERPVQSLNSLPGPP